MKFSFPIALVFLATTSFAADPEVHLFCKAPGGAHLGFGVLSLSEEDSGQPGGVDILYITSATSPAIVGLTKRVVWNADRTELTVDSDVSLNGTGKVKITAQWKNAQDDVAERVEIDVDVATNSHGPFSTEGPKSYDCTRSIPQ